MKRIAVPLIIAMASSPAIGQVAPDEAPSQEGQTAEAMADGSDAGEDEAIVITGSRIRGAGPVGSNVVLVGSDDVQSDPAATVTEFLRKVPQIQGFGVDSSSPSVSGGQGGTNTTRGSALNLRGLGPQATLTLIDGQRLTYSGVASNYVDAAAIPSVAIERIEVVADGASAIYGSDAIAGVVNFILRKKFDGFEVRGRSGVGRDYSLHQVSAVGGKQWGTGGVVLAVERSERDNLNGSERDFNRADLRAFGGTDFRNSQCNPGNIVAGGGSYAIPPGGVTPGTAGQLVRGTRNICENLSRADILPKESRTSVYGYAHQEIGPDVALHVEGFFTDRDFLALGVQQGSTTNIVNLTVPTANPFFVRPPGTTGSSVTVEYDFTPEIGLINQTGITRTLFLTGGAEWRLGSDWRVTAEALYSSDRSAQRTRRIDTSVLNNRLRSTNPAEAFNPFGGGNSRAVLDAIYSGVFNPFATSRTAGASLLADGSLFELPGGTVRLASGLEYVWYSSEGGNRQGALASPVETIFPKLRRNQYSAFAELLVPVFGPGNETPGLRRLELSAALRHDKYSDVGATTNPKVGFNWSPLRGLTVRGSYGTSFRAPSLQDLPVLRTGAALVVSTWIDPLSPTGSSVGLVLNAGNPGLTPESAETWSLGAEFTPDSLPGLQLSATYFAIDYQGLVGFPPRTTQSLLDPDYAFAITRNPSAALIQSYLDQGLVINGIVPPVIAFFYDASAKNLGSIQTDGIDFAASYRFETGIGTFDVGANGSYLFGYDFAVTPLAPPRDRLGTINFSTKFRARGSLGWSQGDSSAELSVNHVGGYRNTFVTPAQPIDSWTTFDLHLGRRIGNASGPFRELSLGLDVSNLFDKDPPFVNIVGGWDPGMASALGRVIAVSASVSF